MTLKEGRRAVGMNPGCFCHCFFQFEGLLKKNFFLNKIFNGYFPFSYYTGYIPHVAQ